jgi:hypothetical protein
MMVVVGAYVPLLQTILWILVVLAIVWFFRSDLAVLRTAVAKRLESDSSFKIGPVEFGELKQEIARVKSDVDAIGEGVSELFLLTMSEGAYFNLQKLASDEFGPYEMSNSPERELRYLRELGYIAFGSFEKIPRSDRDLSSHVKATTTGKRFVQLRERWTQANHSKV